MKLAILDDYQNRALRSAPWDALAEVQIRVFDHHLGAEPAIVASLQPFDILVSMRERTPFPESTLSRLPTLKLLCTTGMRNLAIDLEAARKRGILVCGTETGMSGRRAEPHPERGGSTVSEHTWALILALAKQIPAENAALHGGGWQQGIGIQLRGKTLGLLGLGRVGRQVARLGLAFGMRAIAWSQNLNEAAARELEVEPVSKTELFQRADVLSIHTVLSERTRGIVTARELAAMKPSAFLVNTSRGPIVRESDLLRAIERGALAGAALDVYDTEPLPRDHPLRRQDRLILTGHTGYVVEEFFGPAYTQSLENVRAWLRGAPIRVLNP